MEHDTVLQFSCDFWFSTFKVLLQKFISC